MQSRGKSQRATAQKCQCPQRDAATSNSILRIVVLVRMHSSLCEKNHVVRNLIILAAVQERFTCWKLSVS